MKPTVGRLAAGLPTVRWAWNRGMGGREVGRSGLPLPHALGLWVPHVLEAHGVCGHGPRPHGGAGEI